MKQFFLLCLWAAVCTGTGYAQNGEVGNPPVYLDGDQDYNSPGQRLSDACVETYKPESEYEMTFLGFTYDYDFPEIAGVDSDGNLIFDVAACNYEELYRGDLLRLTVGTHCYEEPGNGEFTARTMVTKIELVEPGPLRRFHENNRKALDYSDDSQYVDRWDTRRLDAIDWFIAASGNKRLKKYMRRPGVLRTHFSDGPETEESGTLWFVAELTNDHNGRSEKIMELLIEINYYSFDTKYYLTDGSGGRRLLDI